MGIADDDEILGAAADLLETLQRAELPDFVAERLGKLETLHAILTDADWTLEERERAPVLAALATPASPHSANIGTVILLPASTSALSIS